MILFTEPGLDVTLENVYHKFKPMDVEKMSDNCCLFCRYGNFTKPAYSTDNNVGSKFKCGVTHETIHVPSETTCDKHKLKHGNRTA